MTVQVEAPEETHEERARRNVEAVNRDAGPDPIRIGVLTPLTPPGDPTAGELISRGARIGAEYVREHGGALGGRNVELLLVNDVEGADDTTMGKTAVEGLKRLDEQAPSRRRRRSSACRCSSRTATATRRAAGEPSSGRTSRSRTARRW